MESLVSETTELLSMLNDPYTYVNCYTNVTIHTTTHLPYVLQRNPAREYNTCCRHCISI